jgi:HPt (histidine-containing phosphotransfer) domain-containing protein
VQKVCKTLSVSEKIAIKIIEKFEKDIKKDIFELEKFIEANDEVNIKEKAHYIKNSCLNVALNDVCNFLQELESEKTTTSEKQSLFKKIKEKLSNYL